MGPSSRLRKRFPAVLLVVAALSVAAALPVLASPHAAGAMIIGSCTASGSHDYYPSDDDRLRFSTLGNGTCYKVKVSARYWTDAPPYGWVNTPTYWSYTNVTRNVYNAPAHDWSKHTVCHPNDVSCDVFSLV
jgi:hypothetical protein